LSVARGSGPQLEQPCRAGEIGLPHAGQFGLMRYNHVMNDSGLHIRCQRCGTEMEMRDPAPGGTWTPDQYWVCPRCGRHFWSTYPPPSRDKAKPAAESSS